MPDLDDIDPSKHDLYLDQVPPHAPGIPGNGETEAVVVASEIDAVVSDEDDAAVSDEDDAADPAAEPIETT